MEFSFDINNLLANEISVVDRNLTPQRLTYETAGLVFQQSIFIAHFVLRSISSLHYCAEIVILNGENCYTFRGLCNY